MNDMFVVPTSLLLSLSFSLLYAVSVLFFFSWPTIGCWLLGHFPLSLPTDTDHWLFGNSVTVYCRFCHDHRPRGPCRTDHDRWLPDSCHWLVKHHSFSCRIFFRLIQPMFLWQICSCCCINFCNALWSIQIRHLPSSFKRGCSSYQYLFLSSSSGVPLVA